MKQLNHTLAALVTIFLLANHAQAKESCTTVKEIEGTYQCGGECVISDAAGEKSLITVSGEVDKISRWNGSKHGIYQINITGGNDFREQEIGSLVGHQMQTATANVSDGQYPVLEQYTFRSNASCQAREFTKTVLNPSKDNFKACTIICTK
jgi:hypothetical protein